MPPSARPPGAAGASVGWWPHVVAQGGDTWKTLVPMGGLVGACLALMAELGGLKVS